MSIGEMTAMAGNLHSLREVTHHLKTGDLDKAARICRRLVKSHPDSFAVNYTLATIEAQSGSFARAKSSIDRALAIRADSPEAWLVCGNILAELGRFDEAQAAFTRSLAIRPAMAEAWTALGNVATSLKQFDEAVAAYDRALALAPSLLHAWYGRGNLYSALARLDEALAAFEKAIALGPEVPLGWHGRGTVLHKLARHEEALAAHEQAVARRPSFAEAWLGAGNALGELGRHDDALAALGKALELKPGLAAAWHSRGNIHYALMQYEEAAAAFTKARCLNPQLPYVGGAVLRCKMHLCDWSDFAAECSRQIAATHDAIPTILPLFFLAIPSSAEHQLRCASGFFDATYTARDRTELAGAGTKGEKTRIGYLSADFREHPVAVIAAGIFEHHDRSRFEVTGFSIGPDDGSNLRRRLEASFDRFLDLRGESEDEIVARVRRSDIDVLVDLNGYTGHARTGVLARGAVPIQVNFLGYPGTIGAPCLDYIIADATVIPPDQRQFYSEKVVHLPHSYLVGDARRAIADRVFDRAELGLPATGFVFCCFNEAYKITPSVFDSWMRILTASPGGVLWLSGANETLQANLRREAAARGVDPHRLVFAARLPSIEEHLARYRSADLFLDTLPYNAHATGLDALWAGVPILTCTGNTFAGRVGTSLLGAIGLPDLAVATMADYEALAVELATHPAKLAEIRRRLSATRPAAPLFDAPRFTRHIEAAFVEMVERHRNGLPPDHIVIPE
ncbi:MAG: tetratricopeptide repeat protein [Candidatus Competibacteraceae bacterium]|nr:tetratricopeptide repeat protein [Candidatus Competibacteraceae bacterium]